MWEIVRNSFDKNEVENHTNFVEVRLFKVFLKLSGYKLCIWKEIYTCELYVVLTPCYVWFRVYVVLTPCYVSFMWFWHHAMCDFPVIGDLVFVVFVTTELNLGQCPFTLDDAFFLAVHGGKRFLDCVWVKLLPMGSRDHMQERPYLTRSLYCPCGERKTLRVWVRLLSIGPRVYIPKRTISCQLWIRSPDQSMW